VTLLLLFNHSSLDQIKMEKVWKQMDAKRHKATITRLLKSDKLQLAKVFF